MPRQVLDNDQSREILAAERLVRVAFQDGRSSYLIPLGYVWLDGALFGVTEAGRKTTLARANPMVAFQVDTSMRTGLWEWASVTGTGRFELAGIEERGQAMAALQPVIAEAPEWWRREQAPRVAAGTLLVWKLTPTSISGCRYAPPREGRE